jgi:UDP-perosamine 4-acetyltransferase
MKLVWVFGSGGHSKVVIDTLRASGTYEVAGALDDDPERWGTDVLGVPVLGGPSPEAIARFGIDWAVIAIGSNRSRAAISKRFSGGPSWASVVHPRAYVAPGVRIGAGTVIFAGAIVQPGAILGDHVILNTGCSIDHDCIIDDFSHVAPGAHLCGRVRVGRGAELGAGSSVTPGRTVDAWSIVGAGGVVVRDIPAGVTAKGVPARFPTPARQSPGARPQDVQA